MKITDLPQEMNWADYWDALCNQYFELRQSADTLPAFHSDPRPGVDEHEIARCDKRTTPLDTDRSAST
jgi:hypothetical protein